MAAGRFVQLYMVSIGVSVSKSHGSRTGYMARAWQSSPLGTVTKEVGTMVAFTAVVWGLRHMIKILHKDAKYAFSMLHAHGDSNV